MKVNIYGKTRLIDEEAAKKDLKEVMVKYHIVRIEAYLSSDLDPTYVQNKRGDNINGNEKRKKTKTIL